MASILAQISMIDHQAESAVEMSDGLRQKLKLPLSLENVNIRLGRNSTSFPIVFISGEDFLLRFSLESAEKLLLFEQALQLNIRKSAKNQLILGPVIAVMTEAKWIEDQISFGSLHDFCRELAQYCERKGYCFYVFSLKDIDLTAAPLLMKGYAWDGTGWIKTQVPLPDVIHNRIHSRHKETKNLPNLTRALSAYAIPIFNHRYLNKWEVHEKLWENPHLRPFLPVTELLSAKAGLEDFLNEHEDFFIKPITGSQGKRIFRITHKEPFLHLSYTTFSDDFKQAYPSFNDLFQALYPRLHKESFILQKTICIKSFQNRPLDFRVLCHKDSANSWKVTSMIARVSGENQFVANLAQGGRIHPVGEILEQLYGYKKGLHFRKLLKELSLEICTHLEKLAEGLYGEFGIDLAIDEEERVWIIEANIKPSKNAEFQPGNTQIRPSAKAIIDYGLYLSRLHEE
ncbi:YheC/YheD family protein [Metabacillus sp. RGM 3146]|uniref:YheC/YheD family endospore coat-associated protein n=1 Tax=Metabacillus sp. RGM 3146 TaxID=3401092 RepID=UPI003B9C5FA1